MSYPAFDREALSDVIHGRGGKGRVPMLYNFWCSSDIFGADAAEAERLLSEYPCDAERFTLNMPDPWNAPADAPEYKWVPMQQTADENTGLDARIALQNWDDLDEVLAHFPSPQYPGLIPPAPAKGRTYRLAHWWYFFFERMWSLRGMENALTDFYLYPDQVHRLFDALADFYCGALERAHSELGADGIFTSDDIGTQTGPFFSLDLFREFFLPQYKKVVAKAHELGMDFWLHCCGNIEPFIPDLIDIGVDVLHPIQKYTMEEKRIAEAYGSRICIWAGFDVQQTIPYGTPDEVRAEVDRLIDTYARPDGRFMLTLGNGATPDTKLASLRALLEESYRYGTQKMAGFH